MNIRALKCKKCNCIIYSRANHDMKWCKCKSCAIDGGQQNDFYTVSGKSENYELIDLDIDTTIEELYNDWNKGFNKLGLIEK